MRLPSTSREWLRFPVTGMNDLGQAFNPDIATIEVAFTSTLADDPVGASWNPATWITDYTGQTFGRVLVGPPATGITSIDLPIGAWTLWGRFTVGSVQVVRRVDEVIVT